MEGLKGAGMSIKMLTSAVVVFLLTAVGTGLLKILPTRNKKCAEGNFPYEKVTFLMSPTERSFLGALERAVAGEYRIMAKVRMADVIAVKPGLEGMAHRIAFNMIKGRHLDFVAYHPLTFEVMFVVELHNRGPIESEGLTRNDFVDNALRSAGIPIFHFNMHRFYKVQEIRDTLSWRPVALRTKDKSE
jgi:hypothetical protein